MVQAFLTKYNPRYNYWTICFLIFLATLTLILESHLECFQNLTLNIVQMYYHLITVIFFMHGFLQSVTYPSFTDWKFLTLTFSFCLSFALVFILPYILHPVVWRWSLISVCSWLNIWTDYGLDYGPRKLRIRTLFTQWYALVFPDQKQYTEPVVWRYSTKKAYLEIWQYSQDNSCAVHQRRCLPVYFAKLLKKLVLYNVSEWLLLTITDVIFTSKASAAKMHSFQSKSAIDFVSSLVFIIFVKTKYFHIFSCSHSLTKLLD